MKEDLFSEGKVVKDYKGDENKNKNRLLSLSLVNIICSLFLLGIIISLAYFFAKDSKQNFIKAFIVLINDILTTGTIIKYNVIIWKVGIVNIITMFIIGIIFLINLKIWKFFLLTLTIGLVVPLLVIDIVMVIFGYLFTIIILPSTIVHIYTIIVSVKMFKEVKLIRQH